MSQRFDKSRLPSRHVSVGPERAPHRSYYYAMGMTEEEIARPFVAIASAGNDSAPCNTTLDPQANICREGVMEAGGTPRRQTFACASSVVLHGALSLPAEATATNGRAISSSVIPIA